MVRLLSIGIGVVSTMVVLLPIMLVLHYTVFGRHNLKKTIFVFLYAAYLSAVFTPDSNEKYAPIFLCTVVLLIMFVIQPFISSEMWEYVLSSPIWERIR